MGTGARQKAAMTVGIVTIVPSLLARSLIALERCRHEVNWTAPDHFVAAFSEHSFGPNLTGFNYVWSPHL